MPTAVPSDPPYRVTFFYGPEPVQARPECLACVFNVKKRSWKAGIQVAVELPSSQLTRLRESLGLQQTLSRAIADVPPHDRTLYETRADEYFAQAVARCKLDLQLETGLTPHTERLACDGWTAEVDQRVLARGENILSYVLSELDLVPPAL